MKMKWMSLKEHFDDLFFQIPWQLFLLKQVAMFFIVFVAWFFIFGSLKIALCGGIIAVVAVHLIFYGIDLYLLNFVWGK